MLSYTRAWCCDRITTDLNGHVINYLGCFSERWIYEVTLTRRSKGDIIFPTATIIEGFTFVGEGTWLVTKLFKHLSNVFYCFRMSHDKARSRNKTLSFVTNTTKAGSASLRLSCILRFRGNPGNSRSGTAPREARILFIKGDSRFGRVSK